MPVPVSVPVPPAGAAQSKSADEAAVRAENELDADAAGYRQFDEESFSEVLTYYGSSHNSQVSKQLDCIFIIMI